MCQVNQHERVPKYCTRGVDGEGACHVDVDLENTPPKVSWVSEVLEEKERKQRDPGPRKKGPLN